MDSDRPDRVLGYDDLLVTLGLLVKPSKPAW